MAVIYEKLYVKSFFETQYSERCPKSSGYCEDQYRKQQLIRLRKHRLLGFITFTNETILDEEVVPSHVWISLGALGFDSSDWKSKFKELIPHGKVTVNKEPQPTGSA
jgi:hypothetical protein